MKKNQEPISEIKAGIVDYKEYSRTNYHFSETPYVPYIPSVT
jgi:hypothetical protein